ncbi:MAG TPA: hypothetical protein VEU72_03040 [Nitrosopumilaceae archaeon]|nr:hypothetical protein [Nitrosopumilaceae archaeon]
MKIKICPSCKEKFPCKTNSSCWCHELPPIVMDYKDTGDCICPQCLEIQIGNKKTN